jgi:alkyl hydroperoxide reductase subunit AhpC
MNLQRGIQKSDDEFVLACVDAEQRNLLIDQLIKTRTLFSILGMFTLVLATFIGLFSRSGSGFSAMGTQIILFSLSLVMTKHADSQIKFLKGMAALQTQLREFGRSSVE